MEEGQIRWMAVTAALAAAALVFFLLRYLGKSRQTGEKIRHVYREISGLLREKGTASGYYQRSRQWLVKNGAAAHYGNWIEPIRFLVLRIGLGLAGLSGGVVFGPEWGAAGFLLLFFLPGWLLFWLNRRDNERLLPDLKLLYHSLEIQIKAGIYVTDALAECYGSAKEKRLKQALLELAGDIVMKADIYDSLNRFQAKFDNRYVDSLCITILQALESGQAVELLRDIGEQIKDMEKAVLERRKAALDRKIMFCQLGVLTVVLGLALYACVSYMFGSASMF